MKIGKKILHAVPLLAILVIAFFAFAGVPIKKYDKPAQAAGDSSISMTIVGDLDFVITPEVGGVYDEKSLNVIVETNSPAGYTLNMSSKDNSPTATADGQSVGISSVDGFYTIADMPLNTWGFYVDGADMLSAIPPAITPITVAATNSPYNDSNRSTIIHFGVKVAPNIKSGDYGSTITFTAVSNQGCVGIFCLNTMQDMTTAACAETTTPSPAATLIDTTGAHANDDAYIPRVALADTRDGKTYLISKLSDGNCWMSQNLAIDPESSVELTSDNSDIAPVDPDNPPAPTPPGAIRTTIMAYKPSENKQYLQNGVTPAATPTLSDGSKEWESTGYYYDWYTATMGSGVVFPRMQSNYAYNGTNSICPKNWRLPNPDEFNELGSIYYDSHYDEQLGDYVDTLLPSTFFDDKIAFVGSAELFTSFNDDTGETDIYHSDEFGYSGKFWTNVVTNSYYSWIAQGYASASYIGLQGGTPYDLVSIRCVAR